MKPIKTIILFSFLVVVSCTNESGVRIMIENNSIDIDTLYIHNAITEQILARIPLNSSKKEFKFHIKEATLAEISANSIKKSPLIVVSPGAKKIITVDSFGLETKHSIVDSLANYLLTSTNQMFFVYDKIIFAQDNPRAVLALFDSLIQARDELLNEHKIDLTEDEIGILKYQNKARAYSFLMFYGRIMKKYAPTDSFFNFIENIENNNIYTKSLPNNVLYKYEIQFLREKDSIDSIISFLEYIEEEAKQKDIQEFLKAFYLKDVMEHPSYWRKHEKLFTTNTVKEAIQRERKNAYAYLFKNATNSFFSSRKGIKGYDFSATKLDSTKIKLSDLKGKLILIDVWATWCGPCIAQRPNMLALAQKYKNNPNIAVLLISVDKSIEKWKKYVKQTNPNNYGIELIISDGTSKEFGDRYFVKSIPRYILIDKNGIIIDANLPEPSMALEEIIRTELQKM